MKNLKLFILFVLILSTLTSCLKWEVPRGIFGDSYECKAIVTDTRLPKNDPRRTYEADCTGWTVVEPEYLKTLQEFYINKEKECLKLQQSYNDLERRCN